MLLSCEMGVHVEGANLKHQLSLSESDRLRLLLKMFLGVISQGAQGVAGPTLTSNPDVQQIFEPL